MSGARYAAPAGQTLRLPLDEADRAELRAGDIVYLDGSVFTLLDKAFWRIFEDGVDPPLPLDRLDTVVVGGGKVSREGDRWVPDSLTPIPTTGARYLRWIPPLMDRFGIRAVVSKEGMGSDPAVRDACRRHGAVTLAAFSFPPKLLPDRCDAVELREWEELGGPEALTVYRLAGYGPLVVNIDARGDCLAERVDAQVQENARAVYARRGLTAPAAQA